MSAFSNVCRERSASIARMPGICVSELRRKTTRSSRGLTTGRLRDCTGCACVCVFRKQDAAQVAVRKSYVRAPLERISRLKSPKSLLQVGLLSAGDRRTRAPTTKSSLYRISPFFRLEDLPRNVAIASRYRWTDARDMLSHPLSRSH